MQKMRLTRYELELMDVLWRLGQGTVQDVCDNLNRELAYTTVMTTLRLLHSKKKVLKRVKRGPSARLSANCVARGSQPLGAHGIAGRVVSRSVADACAGNAGRGRVYFSRTSKRSGPL